jgi:hypothetical protein
MVFVCLAVVCASGAVGGRIADTNETTPPLSSFKDWGLPLAALRRTVVLVSRFVALLTRATEPTESQTLSVRPTIGRSTHLEMLWT